MSAAMVGIMPDRQIWDVLVLEAFEVRTPADLQVLNVGERLYCCITARVSYDLALKPKLSPSTYQTA